MTQPQQPDSSSAALDQLSRLAAGNDHLVTRPVLMAALVNGNASPTDVSAINEFVGGLEAESAVSQLRASGQKIVLPTTTINQLKAVGAQYQDVVTTPEEQEQKALAQIQKQGLVPVYNNGRLIGARQQTAAESQQHSDGWFDSWGGFWHHLTHNPVTNLIGQGLNFVQNIGDIFASKKQDDENAAIMRSLGYDPNSMISQAAYIARGLMRGDISGIVDKYGQDKVDQAAQYLENPEKYVHNMLQEANQQDPSGKLAEKQMSYIDSKDFGDLLTELSGRQNSLGTDLALQMGLDPVKNRSAYGWVAGATNLVSGFVLDPTMILGRFYKGLRISQVGIKGWTDTSAFARILSKTNRNWFTAPIQDGFQATVDAGNMVRTGLEDAAKAQAAGDLRGYANAQAQVARGQAVLDRAGTTPLLPALLGTHRVVGLGEKGMLETTTEGAEPLDTYDKLFDYVTQTKGMLALRSGKAAVTASLMPGALSRFGSSWLRGVLDGSIESSRASWNFKKLEAASKLMPAADDAVDAATGQVLAAFPSSEALGEVDYNLRRFGNMTGEGIGGALGHEFKIPKIPLIGTLTPGSWINPAAVAARARLAARRLNVTNLIARNNEINLIDELAAGKILAFAKLYLSDAHANMLAAAFAGGDIGTRRAIFAGLKRQVFHSAGLYHSESGTALAEELMQEDEQLYAHTQEGIMERDPWTGALDQSTALWDAQNRLVYKIPAFGTLHRAAAKSGLYEATLGRAMTSHIADGMLKAFRFGILAAPRTATRATAEGWLNLLARGNFRKALAAKARTSELGMLPERMRVTTKLTGWWLPKAVGSAIKNIEKRGMTDAEGEYLQRVMERHPEVAEQVQESLGQHLLKGDINPLDASSDALDIAKAGMRPVKWEQDGWSLKSTAGYYGAHRLEAALKLRQHGNPLTFRAVLDYIEDPSHENMLGVKDAMLAERKGFDRMRWLSTYRNSDGILQRAITADEKQVAFEQHASRLIADLRHLLTQGDGDLAHGLLDKIKADGVPDGDWINKHLANEERPPSAIAPNYLPKIVDNEDDMHTAMDKLGNALQDVSGKIYKAVVVRPAERMTSMPAFWMYYVKARVETADLERQMIEEGYSPETADTILMHSAIREAWVRTEYTVDDPGAKTQMDIVGRNLVMFPRAINAFIRRYGQLVRQDPLVLRKAALALNGAEQMGFIYRNSNGELTYTVPGSNFLVNALNMLGGMMGMQNFVTIPRGDLTGNLMMSAPGFNNPVRTSLTPMLNIPFHFFENLFPDHREFLTEIDNVLNGPTGSNRGVVDSLMPSALRHFYEAMDSRASGSILASSTIAAFSNLVAADPNGTRGIVPPPNGVNAAGQNMAQFLAALKTQVRNQFFMRAALGLFLPGSPSRPTDQIGSAGPDEAYYLRGARSMSDEFKMMLNDYNGDYSAAAQAFASIHPNDLIYTIPTSTVTEAGLNIPATRTSELWMEGHLGLIQKYPLVAAYFAPSAEGKFDANAWHAQLALGLRKQQSLSDFANAYELKRAQATYFAAYDQMSQLRNAALAVGNKKEAAFYKSNFDQQMAPWLATEPQLQNYLTANDAMKTAQAQDALRQLRNMIQSGDAAGLTNESDVSMMLDAYDKHTAYQNDHTTPSADRTYEDATFGAFMTQMVEKNPDLVGLYNVFRAIDWQALPSLTQAV